jgi:hypothetical protein
VPIPNSITKVGNGAFSSCTRLAALYFRGNAPSLGTSVFSGANKATVYYLPGTTGWGPTFGGRPTMLWRNLQLQTGEASFGVRANQFGFNMTGTSELIVVVEASTNIANPNWLQVSTNTLTDGWCHFSDPDWVNYPSRFYRIRSQ